MFVINVILEVAQTADIESVRENLRKAGELSRGEPGCLRFEVYQDQQDHRTFLLCEHWESREAWETHKQAEAFTTIYQPLVLPKVTRTPHYCDRIE